MSDQVTVRDVTLREFGQNVSADGLAHFTVDQRLWLARELLEAGFESIEVASTASATVAPAMAVALLQPFLEALGRHDQAQLITLVPGKSGYARFHELGLGPDGAHHTMGVFVSAMDEHNVANVRRTVSETLEEMATYVPEARKLNIPVVGYVSAAFGFQPTPEDAIVQVDLEQVAALVMRLSDLGASSVTLSDLQGLASPTQTEDLLGELIDGKHASSTPIGYHPHHVSPERTLDNVEAAYRAGVRLFDASLGAVGGCVTGAPGNAPTEGVVERLLSLGASTSLDVGRLDSLAREAERRIFRFVSVARALIT